MTSHDEAAPGIDCSMVGGYATDALSETETAQFERHLAECDSCQRDLPTLRDTLGAMNASAATSPPEHLRHDVLAAIRTVRVEPPLVVANRPATEVRRGRPDLSRTARIVLVAAAALVVALAAVAGIAVQRAQVAERAAASSSSEQRNRNEILSAPDVRAVAFQLPNGGHGVYYLSATMNRGLLIATGLPDPGTERDLQLWTFRDGKPVPNAVLPRGTTIQQVILGDIRGAEGAAITIEPRGGSQEPTTEALGGKLVDW